MIVLRQGSMGGKKTIHGKASGCNQPYPSFPVFIAELLMAGTTLSMGLPNIHTQSHAKSDQFTNPATLKSCTWIELRTQDPAFARQARKLLKVPVEPK
ncbi:elongin-C isoform X2 [Fukomys damarensis]|uniref:elongin-C isoform X2 n=1 Tax=Fukomys damarensis TaxID=885580 RepID=UPI001455ACAF|nr:elongin-C isoform X2 [Fukomys damarensis]